MTLLFPIFIQGSRVIQDEDSFTNKQMDCYNNSWYLSDGKSNKQDSVNVGLQISKNTILYSVVNQKSHRCNIGPMNSSWPIICHDLYHTSQSQYSTLSNYGFEKWRLRSIRDGTIESSAVIDNNGIIYFGTMGSDCALYALRPDGTIIWIYGVGTVWSTPAIDENGVIYVSTILGHHYFYAIYINNGALKWKYSMGGTFSSPAIADDGTIVFGDDNWRIIALYPNGTEKWHYNTGNFVASSPAIADDGTIYCGCSDNYLYALYPNGTLRWRFGTGGWIKGHPSIAEDGTIYVPSFDGYLYALYPNGTLKWKSDTGGNYLAAASAAIASDGTLYVGTDQLRAFYPNGSVKWTIDPLGEIYGTSPAISSDGTIYVSAGQHLLAVNPDGTIKWREKICNLHARSSPCIGEDGTVYVGSSWEDPYTYWWFGYFHAFNQLDPDAPSAPIINGPSSGKAGKEYEYTFSSTSPLGNDVFYYVDWGDGYWNDWVGPYNSSETVTAVHTWKKNGNFTIRVRAKDTDNLWGPLGEFGFEVLNLRPDKPIINGSNRGKIGVFYNFTIKSIDPDENDLYYLIDWGDGSDTYWFGPFTSGEEISRSHKWNWRGSYTIRVKAMDICGAESDWGKLGITIPRNRIINNFLFLRFFRTVI